MIRSSRKPTLIRRSGVAVALVLVLLATPAPARAQSAESREPVFTPTLFVLGSTTDNELRTSTGTLGDSSLYAEVELPFTFRSPRWTGGASFNPAWRKHRDLSALDDFEGSLDGWLSGALSPRTRLAVNLSAVRTAQLSALDEVDLITPRSDRVRGRASAALTHVLNPAGDSINARVDFATIEYLDNDFLSQRDYGVQLGYGHAMGPRLSLHVAGAGRRIEYDGGGWVHTATPLAGFDYRLAPRTDLAVRGGLSFSTGQVGADAGARPVDARELTLEATLAHRGQGWGASLEAGRAIATGVALGEPTVRTRVEGSVSWAGPRWRLGLSAGFARNDAFVGDDGSLLLLGPDGLVNAVSGSIDTVSSCVDLGYRLASWMSVVGSGRVAQQTPAGPGPDLDLSFYRFSLGIAIHPYAGPVNTRRGAEVLRRYGRAGSIGSC